MQYLLNTHNRYGVGFKSGSGCYLKSFDGKKYLDFAAGIAVNSLGYSSKVIFSAIKKQLKTGIIHVSNLYAIPSAEKFAKAIIDNTFDGKVFFCNSGAEAIESVIKIIRRYHFVNGNPSKNRIITFKNSFHGRTIATISASGNKKYLEGFGPALEGFDNIEYGNLDLIEKAIGPQTAGILVEPIQGEGGVGFAGFDFLTSLRKICDKHGILLALDEVQCGMGRTGKLFAYQHTNINPDIIGVAKGIGGGFPLGATIVSSKVSSCIVPGTHGTTYGSNPLSAAIGLAIINQITKPSFLQNVNEMSKVLSEILESMKNKYTFIDSVKGFGLIRGLKIVDSFDASIVVLKARENGLLLALAGCNVVRFLPPLIVGKSEMLDMKKRLDLTLTQCSLLV